ncbi:MAG TPA: molecular chaperone [Lachnospiraceae bacterium]|nr:molecular chaperone [Lachnospiraceae bacterium]
MTKTNYVFKRVEKKFLINESTLSLFLADITPYIKKDDFGQYTICNIYYDTADDLLIRKSIEKPVYKEKLRLRSYGVPNGNNTVFLEIKKKYNETVYKRRISLALNEVIGYLSGESRPKKESQILHEIDYFLKLYHPVPKLFIAYDRLAFSAIEDENLRITVDSAIRSRNYDLSLCAGDYGDYLLNDDERLIEIKTGSSMPLWLTSALTKYAIYPVSFSKYGNIYKQNLQHPKSKSTNNVIHIQKLREAI